MRTLPEAQYHTIGRTVRRQILQSYSADSCIATTRVTVDLLRKMGIDAYALSVKTIVVNRPLYDYAARTGVFPEFDSPDYPTGGYAVGVGYDDERNDPTRWPGHLVAVAERKWLLDFSIDQAHRPQHDIVLQEPLVIPVPEAWLRGRETGHVVYKHGETFLYYTALVGDKSYRVSPNWEGEHAPHLHLRKGQ